jgi:hypothetical protein
MSNLFDILKMLYSNPVSQGNVQNRAYEETPQRDGGGWGFGTSSAFQRPQVQQQQPDLATLLAQTQGSGLVNQIPTDTRPIQQAPQYADGPMTDEMLERALRGVGRSQQHSKPSYDYGAVEQFAGPAYTEGQNTNIQDDSRARALAWIAKQNQG